MKTIAQDNDLFRTTMIRSPRHKVMLSEIVADHEQREDIITAVRQFDTFTEDNDPHQEHDFGSVIVGNEKFYWKIDYYDLRLEYGAEPSEAHVKVLTIMHSSEY